MKPDIGKIKRYTKLSGKIKKDQTDTAAMEHRSAVLIPLNRVSAVVLCTLAAHPRPPASKHKPDYT
jgi:hypothetical protein